MNNKCLFVNFVSDPFSEYSGGMRFHELENKQVLGGANCCKWYMNVRNNFIIWRNVWDWRRSMQEFNLRIDFAQCSMLNGHQTIGMIKISCVSIFIFELFDGTTNIKPDLCILLSEKIFLLIFCPGRKNIVQCSYFRPQLLNAADHHMHVNC